MKKITNIDNIKIQEKIQKKNLSEIILSKLKTKPDSESENKQRGRNINNTNMQLNSNNILNKKKKSHYQLIFNLLIKKGKKYLKLKIKKKMIIKEENIFGLYLVFLWSILVKNFDLNLI